MTAAHDIDLREPPELTKGQRTRARVLDEATAQFGAHGYRTTSVASIARACDIAPTLVFAHWPSKEALFREAVDADARAVVNALLEAVAARGVVTAAALAPVYDLIGILASHPLSRRVLAGHEPDAMDQLLGLDALEEVREFAAAAIAAAQANGDVRADLDAEQAASAFVTLTLTLTMAGLRLPARRATGRVEAVMELLDAALRPPS